MKMEAINRIQGVKVLVGKGKGTKNAFAGDIFECDPKEAERLMKMDAAQEYKVRDRLAEEGEGGEGGEDKAPAKKAAKKPTAAEKKAAAEKAAAEKAADGSDTIGDEDGDLGL